jgi:hypothetical protein
MRGRVVLVLVEAGVSGTRAEALACRPLRAPEVPRRRRPQPRDSSSVSRWARRAELTLRSRASAEQVRGGPARSRIETRVARR